MAISAAMTISSATAKAGQSRIATCTVTNTGASAVNVTAIKPVICSPTGSLATASAAQCGDPPVGPNQTVSVAGSSGTTTFSWPVMAFAPANGLSSTKSNLAELVSYVYDVGATVYTSDGSVTTATVTTLTVTPAF